MESNKRVQYTVKSKFLAASAISDKGILRADNQDAVYIDKNGDFLLLADGMGGHEHGSEASHTVIELISKYLKAEKTENEIINTTGVKEIPLEVKGLISAIDKAVDTANTFLYERNRTEGLDRYSGTTLVGLVPVKDLSVTWFHVGDSRLYRYRDSNLVQLTRDHSAYAEWLINGMSGNEPPKNIVTRAIGPRQSVIPDINWAKYQKNDLYIMCSDGLNEMLTDEDISLIIENRDDTERITLDLVEAALKAGGNDNVSVVVCRLF